ncbi:DUF1549 domain-containing protein [Zavarzinella formosa]|uniref:DUF1549 domain-containing protein n=1 Tax=Zavarzinella formosa TaxID=360055 RepID=UPI0002F89523|nr:DUF1549 domain-containing protein [Zavarzinella formosa]
MSRLSFMLARVVVLSVGLIVVVSMAEPMIGQEAKGKFADPEKAFELADKDKDGKLSKEEFKALMSLGGKLKDNPKVGDFLFDRLDANKDGKLSLDEFKKLREMGAKGKDGFPKKDMPKKEVDPPASKAGNEKPTAEQVAFFEKKIRPVLVAQCYSCHSEEAKKEKGGLLLDTRDAIRKGGETGPAVVPNDLRRSLLLKAIKYTDENLKMPPKTKLSDEVIADFEKWISTGAADPRESHAAVAHAKEIDIEKGRQFWAFQPPVKTPPPAVQQTTWPKNDTDKFILAGLEGRGLKPVGDADKNTLIRRVYFDLIGLPPTPGEVEAFVKDPSPNALAIVIDRLLDSPRFGERWGRHWLDVARYAESSGKAANFGYPHAWRYRDYVIESFNKDKPFDQFVREQLAGDLLKARDEREKAEFAIATGFLSIGPKNHNERNPMQFQMDLADEQIDTTFQAFMGMTVACARCHDHKFDPIPQKDYYSLAGIFRSTETCYGSVRTLQSNHPSPLIPLTAESGYTPGIEPMTLAQRTALEKQITDLKEEQAKAFKEGGFASMAAIRTRVQIGLLESRATMYDKDGQPKLLAMGARERSRASDTAILARGEIDKPGERVARGFPQVMTAKPVSITSGSGRKELADWMASDKNPLTARVFVNRVWSHLFGQGIVPSPDNFGASGQKPVNQPLLDTLAVQFMKDGWGVKKLIRSLMLSHAYQLASVQDAKNFDLDPENTLLWRMSPRRLEAEPIRDSMMAISGLMDLKPSTGSDVARVGEGPVQALQRFQGPFQKDNPHRTVYLTVIREQLPEALTLFDFPDPNAVAGERATTTVPAQSLYLMNNPFVIRQSEAVADKLLASGDDEPNRIKRAYEMFYARPPNDREVKAAGEFLTAYAKQFGGRDARRKSWSALAQAMFASAEFANLR